MEVDLTSLHNGSVFEIDISGVYEISDSYQNDADIVGLNKVVVDGKITRKENDDLVLDDYIDCTINGSMIILDSISLEEIEYPFSLVYSDFIDENWRKSNW